MTDKIGADAQTLRKLIREAEAISDEAMIALARLKQAMLVARQNPDVPVDIGQRAIMRLTQAEAQAMSMSSNIFRVHAELNDVAKIVCALDQKIITPLATGLADHADAPEIPEHALSTMDFLAFPYRFMFQMACFVALAVWAMRRGGGPEKICSAIFIGMFAVDQIYDLLVRPAFELEKVDAWLFALDIAVLAAFVSVALRANRLYPMVLAACQLIAVNSHQARDSFEQITPIAYVVMVIAPSYLQLVTLGCGIWAHTKRVERYGPYRDWRLSPRPT